ncbi:MAG: alpha-galactosidase, partial [Spirochaetia bacterium]|nr:alpha-galactosidase [Spirochaetia bacterium]
MKAVITKPLLGWNSFDCYGIFANERVLRANLEAFDKKLKPHGYEYFVLAAGWYSYFQFEKGREFPVDKRSYKQELDGFGRCIPAPHLFPSGLRSLVDEAHCRGIKFGIHIMRGIPRQAVEMNLPIKGTSHFAKDIADQDDRCPWNEVMFGVDMSKPGAQAYYDSVVEYLVNELDVDFIKADDITPFPDEVEAVARAVAKVKKTVVLSLSPGNHISRNNLSSFQMSDMLRLSGDVWDSKKDLDKCFDRWETWQEVSIPNLWLDLDMIPFGALQVYADVAASH